MKNKAKTIMIQGTGSGVGKSVLVAGLCRIFADAGYRTAPFKAQNMSLNCFVTKDGGEIGRAQAMQAEACRMEPTVDINPVLMKPTADKSAQIIVRGKPLRNMKASEYDVYKVDLRDVVMDSFKKLSSEYEIIVIEGAGSPAEINLRKRELVNMYIAARTQSPVIIAGDIDKGGVFASLWGTYDLLTQKERELVAGFIINKFRGDFDILKPGLDFLEKKTGKKVYGVLPYFHDIFLEEEDSITFQQMNTASKNRAPDIQKKVSIGVMLLPHIADITDVDPLALEPDVNLTYIDIRKDDLENKNYDLVIIPGTKSTVSDLVYLNRYGFKSRIKKLSQKGVSILGICGGYQMLGKNIQDPHRAESDIKKIEALGLLDIQTIFDKQKVTRQVEAVHIDSGLNTGGYEIHMGKSYDKYNNSNPVFRFILPGGRKILDGTSAKCDKIWGTYLHGLFRSREFCRFVIDSLRKAKGLPPLKIDKTEFVKDLEYDKLARLMTENLNIKEIAKAAGINLTLQ